MSRRPGVSQGRCLACRHPRRAEAEMLLARGVPCSKVSAKFAIGNSSLWNHWRRHVSEAVKAELRAGENIENLADKVAEESTSVLSHFARVRNSLYRHFEAAGEASDRINIDRLAGRLHQNFEHVARITGELSRSPLLQINQNIINSPEVARIIAAVVSAVSPYADARIAVAQALRRLESVETALPALEHLPHEE